jgi:hypothetical protein
LASNALHTIASRGRRIGRRPQLRDEPQLPVIAFHFKILEHLMVGGFIGVDVFFLSFLDI